MSQKSQQILSQLRRQKSQPHSGISPTSNNPIQNAPFKCDKLHHIIMNKVTKVKGHCNQIVIFKPFFRSFMKFIWTSSYNHCTFYIPRTTIRVLFLSLLTNFAKLLLIIPKNGHLRYKSPYFPQYFTYLSTKLPTQKKERRHKPSFSFLKYIKYIWRKKYMCKFHLFVFLLLCLYYIPPMWQFYDNVLKTNTQKISAKKRLPYDRRFLLV